MPPFGLDLKVNVRRASTRVRDWLQGAEIILAGGTGQEPSKPLKVRIVAGLIAAIRQINAVVIGAPNLNGSIANWIASPIEHPSAQMSNFAHCGRNRVVDKDKVVIRVQRELGG
jgi:hypothetical protein